MTLHYARCRLSAASFVAAAAEFPWLFAVDPAAVIRLKHDPEK
jgi:hypothetical protein